MLFPLSIRRRGVGAFSVIVKTSRRFVASSSVQSVQVSHHGVHLPSVWIRKLGGGAQSGHNKYLEIFKWSRAGAECRDLNPSRHQSCRLLAAALWGDAKSHRELATRNSAREPAASVRTCQGRPFWYEIFGDARCLLELKDKISSYFCSNIRAVFKGTPLGHSYQNDGWKSLRKHFWYRLIVAAWCLVMHLRDNFCVACGLCLFSSFSA